MTQNLRSGRISNYERFLILSELGKIAQQKYNEYLFSGSESYNYNLRKLRNSLQFEPDISNFDNAYWIDTGNEELTKVAYYFEYGTGIFNTTGRRGYITPKKGEFMVWKDKQSRQLVFVKRTKGVQPIFMMTKAVNYIRNNREVIQRQIRIKLGLSLEEEE